MVTLLLWLDSFDDCRDHKSSVIVGFAYLCDLYLQMILGNILDLILDSEERGFAMYFPACIAFNVTQSLDSRFQRQWIQTCSRPTFCGP